MRGSSAGAHSCRTPRPPEAAGAPAWGLGSLVSARCTRRIVQRAARHHGPRAASSSVRPPMPRTPVEGPHVRLVRALHSWSTRLVTDPARAGLDADVVRPAVRRAGGTGAGREVLAIPRRRGSRLPSLRRLSRCAWHDRRAMPNRPSPLVATVWIRRECAVWDRGPYHWTAECIEGRGSSRSTAPRPTRCRTCDRADSAPAASDAVASREARCRHRSQLSHHPGAFPFAACTWLVLKRRARLNAAEAHATGDGQGTAARAERLLLCKPSPLRQATASGISEAARPPCKRRGIRARGSLLDSPPTCSATISTVGDPDRAPRPAPTASRGRAGDRPCVPGPRRSSFYAGGADPVRGAERAQVSRVRRSCLEGIG